MNVRYSLGNILLYINSFRTEKAMLFKTDPILVYVYMTRISWNNLYFISIYIQ